MHTACEHMQKVMPTIKLEIERAVIWTGSYIEIVFINKHLTLWSVGKNETFDFRFPWYVWVVNNFKTNILQGLSMLNMVKPMTSQLFTRKKTTVTLWRQNIIALCKKTQIGSSPWKESLMRVISHHDHQNFKWCQVDKKKREIIT